ncbi:MAG: hypothetical protein R2774_11140 [Saprospiraceae bacterium]
MSKRVFSFFILVLLGITIVFQACNREPVYTGDDVSIKFSVDTLMFDTVFTTIGSSTRFVKIYNNSDRHIQAEIDIKENSFFRINVDGTPGPNVKNVSILGNDSIYIFVEVNINPDQPLDVSPFIIQDAINITVNGVKNTIYLEAFGQNANYIPGQNVGGLSYKIPCNNGTYVLDDEKPYVIYGVMIVDSCTMVVTSGSKLYLHGGLVRTDNSLYNDGMILVLKDGSVRFEGTIENPITIQGDRLEPDYSDVPGQYAGIVLWQESKNNIFKYTNIKNAIVGIRMDSLAQMEMYNCQIFNTSDAGISSRYSKAKIQNSLLYENYGGGLIFSYGGQYDVQFCTVGSYIGQNPALYISNYYCPELPCDNRIQKANLEANFTNCIFSGSQTDEVILSQTDGSDFLYHFDHCLVRVDDLIKEQNFPDFFDHCISPINYQDIRQPLFLDYNTNSFTLDTMSIAREKGRFISNIHTDIEGKLRKSVPDLGCYELNL